MKVPPGVSPGDFAEAIEQFERAVGKQWVFTNDEDVALYRDAYSPFLGEPDEIVASAAVAPDGVEQVQSVVRIANRRKIPIYTISTGRNLGYGGSASVLSGSVVLDLKRMNTILEVNERNAYALVEPGVSYFDLYRHIQEKRLKLWLDVPDPGWGSLVGNSLDHGTGYTPLPFRDHFESHWGMEVVLANGEVLRTGMGAVPKAQTWQQFKYGLGTYVDGLFSQSNFGVERRKFSEARRFFRIFAPDAMDRTSKTQAQELEPPCPAQTRWRPRTRARSRLCSRSART